MPTKPNKTTHSLTTTLETVNRNTSSIEDLKTEITEMKTDLGNLKSKIDNDILSRLDWLIGAYQRIDEERVDNHENV